MRKTSVLLMIITVLTKVFGLAREKTLAQLFGATAMADIFLVAFSIPMVITNLLTGAIGTGFIPMYDRIRLEQGRARADLFTANLANVMALVFAVVAVLGILGARPLISLMGPGFAPKDFETCVSITRIVMVSVLTTSVASIFRAYLQIYKRFAVSVIHPMIMNILLMVAMALGRFISVKLMAWGILGAFVFQYVIFIPFVRMEGYHHRVLFSGEDRHIRQMMAMILPIVVSTGVIELNYIINKSLASSIAVGGISAMNYASRLIDFVTGIVITSIVTVTYPQMAKAAGERDQKKLGKVTGESLSMMSILILPAATGLMLLAEPIVRLLFLGGAFGKQDAFVTGQILFFYALGVVGLGIREILTRVFYAKEDMKTPVINSVIMVVTNVILSFTFRPILGLKGLALATSISLYLGAALLYIPLRKDVGLRPLKTEGKNLLKILLATGVLAGAVLLARHGLRNLGDTWSLLLTILFAAGCYGIALLLLKVEEVEEGKRALMGLLGKK